MFEYSIYSVISPEGCASILYKDASKANIAAESLKMTSKHLKRTSLLIKSFLNLWVEFTEIQKSLVIFLKKLLLKS